MSGALSRQLIDYVEAHYCEDISLESVANAFHLSASYVSSLFKQQANKGFRKYIIDRRIEQAQKLLLTSSMERQARVRDVLAANGIPYRVKTSSNISRSRGVMPGMRMDMLYQYSIYVKKDDYEKARHLIR